MRFDVAVTGSGGLEVARVAADNLFVSLLGSGRIAVGGAAEKLTAAISGSGDFDARELTVEQDEVNAATAGTIAVTVTETDEVNAHGSGAENNNDSPKYDASARAIVDRKWEVEGRTL